MNLKNIPCSLEINGHVLLFATIQWFGSGFSKTPMLFKLYGKISFQN